MESDDGSEAGRFVIEKGHGFVMIEILGPSNTGHECVFSPRVPGAAASR